MNVLLLLGIYFSVLLVVVVALLFGENPAFASTPLPRLHWLLTTGLGNAFDRLGSAVQRLPGGRRLAACAQGTAALCFERRNPAVQLLFLCLLCGCYWLFCSSVFPMLPLPGLPAWHKYTGTAAAAACLAAFAAASFCDPGRVTAANLAAHQALYPNDGLVYKGDQDCWTCSMPRPARSGHCRLCGMCIARRDHHCAWINRCVGLNNMRYFLLFLFSTMTVCCYGAALGVSAIRADMALHRSWDVAFTHGDTGEVTYLGDSWNFLLRYLSLAYPSQVAATFFVGACGWIVCGFTGYTLFLICSGVTTIEVHKRRELGRALREEEEEARRIEQRVERQLAAGRGDGLGSSAGHRQQQQQQQQHHEGKRKRQPLPNLYARGAWRNLSEVLFPHHHLRQAAEAAAAAGEGGASKKQC